jgi:hypothetical protein
MYRITLKDRLNRLVIFYVVQKEQQSKNPGQYEFNRDHKGVSMYYKVVL